MVDLWKREPPSFRQSDRRRRSSSPGLRRSGATLLHELLACDPDNRPPLLWELLHTMPYEDSSSDVCDDEIKAHGRDGPGLHRHARERRSAARRVHLRHFAHQFSSDIFTGLYNVAELHRVAERGRPVPIYDWHKRHLQTLQWVAERPTGALGREGALAHLSALPSSSPTYPDAASSSPTEIPLPSSAPSRPHGHPALPCTRTTSTTVCWSSSWPWASRCRWTP